MKNEKKEWYEFLMNRIEWTEKCWRAKKKAKSKGNNDDVAFWSDMMDTCLTEALILLELADRFKWITEDEWNEIHEDILNLLV